VSKPLQQDVTEDRERQSNPTPNDKALDALSAYDIGKSLVIEETFPLKCSPDELQGFLKRLRDIAKGWISFHWGKTIKEYAAEEDSLTSALVRTWLERFRTMAPRILALPGARGPSARGGV